MEGMSDSLIATLLQLGALGPVLVAVGWYVLKLQRELKEVHEARTTDAQAVTDRVLALASENNAIGAAQAQTQEGTRLALQALADRTERLEDAVRDHRSRGGGE